MATDSPVVHCHTALMLCDSAAVLEETLAQIDFQDLPHQRIGDRAIVAPAYVVETIQSALRDRGTYPRVVGSIVAPAASETGDVEGDEEAVS